MTTLADVTSALGGRFNGSDAYRCPCHNDDNPSLSVSEGADGRILLHCHAGCSQERLVAWARSRGFDLSGRRRPAGRIIAEYSYLDEHGVLRFQVVRLSPKSFRQRQPDGKGDWLWNMEGVEPLPYRLPELLAAPDRPVFIVEGEKDSDRLAQEGLIATCNHAGAGKWRSELNGWFKDRDCVILPDADEPGRDHAADVAKKLNGTARRVRVLELSGLAQKQDVSDWLDAGHDVRELRRLARAAPTWTPADPAAKAEPDGDGGGDDGEDADEAADARPPTYSDEALALRFSTQNGADLRHVALWGKWLIWKGSVWRFDDTMHAFDLARAIAREASAEIVDPKLARLAAAVASAKVVAAVVSLARADRRHAATASQWDVDPWFISTEGKGDGR